ncbi:MAG: hypothetical protein HW397_573, partial [Dehalococcoidia bacterium]|nr:hypothetical protein [Dehalococcoidia bacterium]
MMFADEQIFRWINGLTGELPGADRIGVLLASDFLLPVLIAAAAWSLWFLGGSATE